MVSTKDAKSSARDESQAVDLRRLDVVRWIAAFHGLAIAAGVVVVCTHALLHDVLFTFTCMRYCTAGDSLSVRHGTLAGVLQCCWYLCMLGFAIICGVVGQLFVQATPYPSIAGRSWHNSMTKSADVIGL